jgi:trans-aconitate 2-methyltransferase
MSRESRQPDAAYLFGDSDLAAARLRLLADVFAPSTREFLVQLASANVGNIADLGCGPGYTTRLLAEVFPAANVCGVDTSEHFIALAARSLHPRTTYRVADATHCVPAGPYDLIYCRYLLTHVSEPEAAIDLWSTFLRPGGRIAVEENEWIRTQQPAFARYLEIVAAMLAAEGKELYLGPRLDRGLGDSSLIVKMSELTPIVVSDRDAAWLFWMNLQSWRRQPFVEQSYRPREINALEGELLALGGAESGQSSITFGRRRLVLQRKEAASAQCLR